MTIYIDGLPANTNIWAATDNVTPGYGPCTGDHVSPPFGQPGISLGGYNNGNSGGNLGDANPWIGGVDEFAWYPAKLTAAQIQAHYQNGTNANRSQSYSSLVLSHNPTAYLRLNEIAPGADAAVNYGSVGRDANAGAGGAAGLGTNTAGVRHPAIGAVVSDKKSGAFAYHNRGSVCTTDLPFNSENNGDPIDPTTGLGTTGTGSAGTPFTFEAWLRPMRDQQGGQCPCNNRSVGGTGRTGWVIFQRNPNRTYPASEGYGWNFRMYYGQGSSTQDILTGDDPTILTNYTIGKWQHLVVTWEPAMDMGDLNSNGNDVWQGTLTGYADGVPVTTNANILYAANRLVPEAGANSASGGAPADLSIGTYNAASGLGSDPYEGDVSELAIYNGYVLTPAQIQAHYQAGTNGNFGANYASMVLTAAAVPPITERTTLPATYFRLNDTAQYPAANSGSLGYLADGSLVLTTNIGAGPITAGFDNPNPSVPLDGIQQWASFNNPSGLNISGQITLEAWVKPGATQGATARFITHGPPLPSDILGGAPDIALDGSLTTSNEVFLRIEGSGANYSVGSSDGTTFHGATAAVPGGDLGSAQWIHLAGTYDGANWRLYRNGVQLASAASAVGALPVLGGDWAVGATGQGWADNFTGGIDEAAIYGTALSPATIKAHYYVGINGPVTLTITPAAANTVNVTWPAGTLQQASSVTGPYTDVLVTGNPATSPYNTAAAGAKFYRVRL